jgi:putative ABC transport system permease protein
MPRTDRFIPERHTLNEYDALRRPNQQTSKRTNQMGITEAFRMAASALRAHKTRTALTLLGMVIGVFAIIAAVTAVEVIDLYFKDSLRFMGASTFTVARHGPRIGGGGEHEKYRPPITYDQVQQLREMSGGELTVSPLEGFDRAEKISYSGRSTEPKYQIYGTDEHFLGNFGYELDEGRPLTRQDVRYGRPVALISQPVAEELFPNETALGKSITAGNARLEVVGVLKEKGSFLGYRPDDRVFMPISYAFSTYGEARRNISQVSVRAGDITEIPQAMERVTGHMRVIRQVAPGEENNFDLQTNDSIRGVFDTFTRVLTIGGAGIGAIALLAAGIGIMNIMLVSVRERTREVGVRKAVGAKRRDILRQFLLEAFFLCLIGGVLGVAFGALFGNGVAVYFDLTVVFPLWWALGAVVMVTFMAVVFGAYPAYKAAGLDPIESLRYE